jgi:hypothetical protein
MANIGISLDNFEFSDTPTSIRLFVYT